MKPQQIELLLLLEQSGELSPKQESQLQSELAASEEARQLQKELRGLAAAISPVEAQPAPDAAARITARLHQSAKPTSVFRPIWKPALAAAAALAILFGVQSFHNPATTATESAIAQLTAEEEAWLSPFEADFTEIENLLAAIDSDNSINMTEL